MTNPERTTTDPKDREFPYGMAYPHYSDSRFDKGPLTTFVAPGASLVGRSRHEEVEGAFYQYPDRLMQADPDKYERAAEAARQVSERATTPRYYEELLRNYFEDPTLELVHVSAGVNRSNGFPYWALGYKQTAAEAEE